MASGLFNLKQQLQGIIQNAWTTPQPTYYGSFNGTNQYLSSPSIALGSGNWTIEFFLYLNAIGTAFYFDGRGGGTNGLQPTIYYNGAIYFYTNGGIVITGSTPNTGQWYHVAVSKVSGSTRLFLNGIQQGSTYSDSNTYVASSTNIQWVGGGGAAFTNGLISNVRVTNTGLYSANFAPPTSQLTAVSGTQLLTLQNATIVDNSTNAYTITNNGSVTTTQTNQTTIPGTIFGNAQKTPAVEYLVVAGGGGAGSYDGGGGAGGLLTGMVPVTIGTSYTVTVGAGGTGNSTSQGVQGASSVFGSISATGGGFGGYPAGNGGSGGGAGQAVGATTPYSGGQGVFGQGNAGGSYAYAGSGTSNYVGGGGGGGAGTVGFNGAVLKGGNGGAGIASAISGTVTTYAGGGGGCGYSAGGPVVAGTGGVGGGGNGGADTATAGTANTGGGGGGGAPGASGAAGGSGIVIISYPDTYNAPSALTGTYTASTSGSGSVLFSGAQYIATADTTNVGSGNFTVEGWFYFNSFGGSPVLVDTYNGTSTNSWNIYGTTSNHFAWFSGAGTSFTGSATLSTGTWYHLAAVRSGTTIKTYVNGVQDGTVTDATNYNATGALWIGAQRNAGPQEYFSGYASNVRIIVGTAVYTANFTPPTAPLTAISGTQYLLSTVSGSPLADGSGNNYNPTVASAVPTWNQLSPFATGLGYKKRVYTWTASGSVTF